MKLKLIIAFFITVVCNFSIYSLTEFSGELGDRNYKLYVPNNPDHKMLSLIIMLHGCEQSADEFAISSHILDYAEKENFAVLLPDQSKVYNPFKCWNWIVPFNNSRLGEAEIIINILDHVIDHYEIDKNRIFAAGMSAGGAMASILGNCYADRVKAIASHDGVQFYPTYTGADFLTVVLNGASVPAEQSALLGYSCSMYFHPPKNMPAIIFHGLASPLMNPMHAFQIEDEFAALNDYLDNGLRDYSATKDKKVETVPDSQTYGYTKYTLIDKKGSPYIERYMINQLNHSWSGGDGRYKYNDPKGPDATNIIINFFKRFGL